MNNYTYYQQDNTWKMQMQEVAGQEKDPQIEII